MKSPLISFAAQYFLAFSVFSIALAFFPLYCEALGFSPFMISVVSACVNIGTLVGIPLCFRIVRTTLPVRTFMPLLGVILCAGYLLLGITEELWLVLLIWAAISFAQAGALGLLDFYSSTTAGVRFERARVWGSIGFIVGAAITGKVIDLTGIQSIIPLGVILTFAFLVCAVWSRPVLESDLADRRSNVPERRKMFSWKTHEVPWAAFIPLVLSMFCVWTAHAPLYVFFSVYLKELGWSAGMVGLAWNVGAIAEIFVFFGFAKLTARYSYAVLFHTAIIVSALRWLLLASYTDPLTILLSQTLHAFSFGLAYLSSLRVLHSMLPTHERAFGQSIWASIGMGGGSLFGRLAAGYALPLLGPVAVAVPLLFDGAVIFMLLALVLSLMSQSALKARVAPVDAK